MPLYSPINCSSKLIPQHILALPLYIEPVTEPSRRYILDKIVEGFINVLSTSHVCPRGDIVR